MAEGALLSDLLLKHPPPRPDCEKVTLFHVALLAIIAVVAAGILRTLREIRRLADDPEQLAERIRAAVEASGVDTRDAQIEVKVDGVPRAPMAQPLLPERPTSVGGSSASRGGWLLALAVAGAIAWAALKVS